MHVLPFSLSSLVALSRRQLRRALPAAIATLVVIPASGATAQGIDGDVPDGAGVTATPGARSWAHDRLYAEAIIPDGRQQVFLADTPEYDSTLLARTKQWVASLQQTKVSGLQLDPMGMLYVRVGQDALAQQQFNAKLATRGLSVGERAFTLFLATVVFGADVSNADRVHIALQYLKQLDALPASALRTQYDAHMAMGGAYYIGGDAKNTIWHIEHAFSLMPQLPFHLRETREFLMLADALSGQPNGRAEIDSVGKWLLTQFVPTPAMIAEDSANQWMGVGATENLKSTIQLTNYLGKPAEVITAQYWWNAATPTTVSAVAADVRTKALNDGTIRVLEFGDLGCRWCQVALDEFNRLYKAKKLPAGAEVWYVTITSGAWGAEPCTGPQEAVHLKHYYLDSKGIQLPIALWAGADTADINGGMRRQESPTWHAYGIQGGPFFVIVDGHGIVRHISMGYTKHMPVQLGTLKFLAAEAAQQKRASQSTPSMAPSATASTQGQ